MLIVDSLILDPADFVPNGAELDLSGAGFRVLDANFGDADVELELQRQAIGEVPTTYHPPNTVTTLALGVRAEGDVDLPTAAHQLAAKVGEINTPGTEHWLRRDFEVGGSFAGPLGKRVYKATLSGLGAWQRGDSPDVVLTLVTGPYWYATVEQESAVFESEAGARELIFELAEVLGTAPGLIRIRITNEGEEDWRGLILAGESRDMAQDETADTTAAPAYAAADLTPKGGAEVKEVEGIEVVEHDDLTAGWLSILNSKLATSEMHMTHLGVRRPYIRAEAVEGDPEDIQLRLRWRSLGAVRWSENRIVPLNIVGGYQIYDLGEARPERAALGDQRWEWDLQARALSGAGKVRLHRVWPLPTEQFCVVKSPGSAQAAEVHKQTSPVRARSLATSEGAFAWSNFNNAKLEDASYASANIESKAPYISEWLWLDEFGFALPEDATIVNIVLGVKGYCTGPDLASHPNYEVHVVKNGVVEHGDLILPTPTKDSWRYVDGLHKQIWSAADINADDFGMAILAYIGSAAGTAYINAGTIGVYYTEAAEQNRVCFAERSAELRTDGVFRQSSEDDVWGELIPDGFLPHASPSGLEGRKSRFIFIPTQGDLGELADGGDNALATQSFARPAYLFAREAA